MEDVFAEVVHASGGYKRDRTLLQELFSFIEASPSPFFAHVHLMATHGRRFRPEERLFSKGKTQDRDWMVDFYDDAIRDLDRNFEEMIRRLKGW